MVGSDILTVTSILVSRNESNSSSELVKSSSWVQNIYEFVDYIELSYLLDLRYIRKWNFYIHARLLADEEKYSIDEWNL